MLSLDAQSFEEDYDEFAIMSEEFAEYDIPRTSFSNERLSAVHRQHFMLKDRRIMSGLKWGASPPELVLLHGGAQNAHTWDAVAIALDRPLLALDLPSHGHSECVPLKSQYAHCL